MTDLAVHRTLLTLLNESNGFLFHLPMFSLKFFSFNITQYEFMYVHCTMIKFVFQNSPKVDHIPKKPPMNDQGSQFTVYEILHRSRELREIYHVRRAKENMFVSIPFLVFISIHLNSIHSTSQYSNNAHPLPFISQLMICVDPNTCLFQIKMSHAQVSFFFLE